MTPAPTTSNPSIPCLPTGNARGRRTRARLLEAASRSFGAHGWARTRVADITAEAGISQGAFYRHFGGKNELLVAAQDGPLDRLLEALEGLRRGPAAFGPDGLRDVHGAFFRAYAGDRRVLRVLREAAAMHEPELVELWLGIRRRYLAEIERWLHGLVAAGVVDAPGDPELLAEALGAVVEQMAYTRLGLAGADPDPAVAEGLAGVTARIWAGALGLDAD